MPRFLTPLLVLGGQAAAAAQCVDVEDSKLVAPNGEPEFAFGSSVSVSGCVMAVGAFCGDPTGAYTCKGLVYVFQRSAGSGSFQQWLSHPGAQAGDWFGYSVAASGDALVGGAPGVGSSAQGAAYVYRLAGTSWVLEGTLAASDGQAQDWFGASVALSGNVAVAGAPFSGATDQGAAYVYRFDGTSWSEEQKLTAGAGAGYDLFGYWTSISGDLVAVGAPLHDLPGEPDAGAVYVFRHDGVAWVEEQKLVASDAKASRRFGEQVSSDGARVAVGMNSGAKPDLAYVFAHDGTAWVEEQRLDVRPGQPFGGTAVSVRGDLLAVGGRYGDGLRPSTGVVDVYRFDGTAWRLAETLAATDGSAFDRFGEKVSFDGDALAAGAAGDDPDGSNSGSAYLFDLGDLALAADPLAVDPGDNLALSTCGGLA